MKGRAPANLLKRIIVENNSKLKINFIGHGSGTWVATFYFLLLLTSFIFTPMLDLADLSVPWIIFDTLSFLFDEMVFTSVLCLHTNVDGYWNSTMYTVFFLKKEHYVSRFWFICIPLPNDVWYPSFLFCSLPSPHSCHPIIWSQG